jgi:hypothetical protein
VAVGLGALIAAHISWAETLDGFLSGGLSTDGLGVASGASPFNGGSTPLLPAAPGVPSSTGSTSSGLGSSAGGLGFGVLALLLALSPLGLRLLRHSPNILRPNSALVLAIERPG